MEKKNSLYEITLVFFYTFSTIAGHWRSVKKLMISIFSARWRNDSIYVGNKKKTCTLHRMAIKILQNI